MAIVVGADGSDLSKEALRWAITDAKLRGTSVVAIRAWEVPFIPPTIDPFPGGPVPDGTIGLDPQEVRESVESRLAAFVAEVAGEEPGVEIESRAIEGHPVEILVEASKEAELLVVASRGHGGFTGLLLGSVSQACAQHAHCPVVIVRGGE
jgi:nucleotide-binding universal stress UspA family protein